MNVTNKHSIEYSPTVSAIDGGASETVGACDDRREEMIGEKWIYQCVLVYPYGSVRCSVSSCLTTPGSAKHNIDRMR